MTVDDFPSVLFKLANFQICVFFTGSMMPSNSKHHHGGERLTI